MIHCYQSTYVTDSIPLFPKNLPPSIIDHLELIPHYCIFQFQLKLPHYSSDNYKSWCTLHFSHALFPKQVIYSSLKNLHPRTSCYPTQIITYSLLVNDAPSSLKEICFGPPTWSRIIWSSRTDSDKTIFPKVRSSTFKSMTYLEALEAMACQVSMCCFLFVFMENMS